MKIDRAVLVRLKTAATAALLIAAAASAAALAADGPAVSPWWKAYLAGSKPVALPDSRTLNLYCEGAGAPTVIMKSGLGSGAWTWRKVQDEIAKSARVCVYDRSGYFGRSAPAPDARDAGAEEGDLSALLKAAALPGPYVLVGHSYGGYIVRLFAYRHPASVAGLVLVDVSSEHQEPPIYRIYPQARAQDTLDHERLQVCAAAGRPDGVDCILRQPPKDLPEDMVGWFRQGQDWAYAKTMLAETDAMGAASSDELVRERKSLGRTPVVLLERDLKGKSWGAASEDDQARLSEAWHGLHVQTLIGISSALEISNVAGAGHRIQDDKPDAVIAAVIKVVERVRKSARR